MSNLRDDPLLILGFHHSGTRLLARQLAAMGVFQVVDDSPSEWVFIQRMNERICPCWCDPTRLGQWIDENAPAAIDHAQLFEKLSENGLTPGTPWGIKDPRLCVTAPVWSKSFRNSRSVIIHRDPFTVLGSFPDGYSYFTPGKARPLSRLDFWAALYSQYYNAMRRHAQSARSILELRFEDLTSQPEIELQRMAEFLALHDVEDAVRLATRSVMTDKSRIKQVDDILGSKALGLKQIDDIISHTGTIRRELGYAPL